MISISRLNDTEFQVTVKEQVTTMHTVTLEPQYYEKLTAGKISPETLIRKSFEFLLERESNTSIFRNFNLRVISHYFPDYESDIRKRK